MTDDISKNQKKLKAKLLKKQKDRNKNPYKLIPTTQDAKPEVKYGKRGGRYTEDQTKDGRPYRRYF